MERLSGLLQDCSIVPADDQEQFDCLDQLMSSLSLTSNEKLEGKGDDSALAIPKITELVIPPGQPRQQDGSSCGPFTCAFAKALVDGTPITDIHQTTVDSLRRSMIQLFLQNK